MKRKIRALTAATLAVLILTMNLGTVFAAKVDKNETVYVKMNSDGTTKSCDIVNWKNANGDNIYSNETSNSSLPLKVDITYYLNGEKIDADKLGGASGEIEIKIHIKNNTADTKKISYDNFISGVAGTFSKKEYTPFMAQVGIDLPLKTFSDINAPGAATVLLGETMKLTWLKFPYPEVNLSVKMKAKSFELGSISVTMLPQMPPISSIEIESSLIKMYNGISDMDDSAKLLIKGVKKAQTGSAALKNGIDEFAANFSKAAAGSSALAASVPGLSTGLLQVSSAASQLGLATDAQMQMIDNIQAVNSGLQSSIANLSSIPGMETTVAQLTAALQKQQALIALLKNGGTLPDSTAFPGLSTTKNGLTQLKGGIDSLSGGSDKLSAATAELSSGLQKLNSYLPAISSGAKKLDAGILTIGNGLSDFRTLGIIKLKDGVADQINTVRKGLAEEDAVEQNVTDYTSFTGDNTGSNSKVEFLLQTDSIKAPETNAVIAGNTTSTNENKGIFESIADFFRNLFGIR